MSLIMITTGSSWISSGSGSWGWTSAWPVLVSITNVYDSSPGPNDCKKIVLHGKVFTRDITLIIQRRAHKEEAATYDSVLKKFAQYYIYSHNTYQGLEWKEIWDLRNDVFSKAIWLTDWLIDWLSEWLTDWWTGGRMDRLTDGLTDWLAGWLTDWQAGCLFVCLTDWLTDWMTEWLGNRDKSTENDCQMGLSFNKK